MVVRPIYKLNLSNNKAENKNIYQNRKFNNSCECNFQDMLDDEMEKLDSLHKKVLTIIGGTQCIQELK